MFSSSSTADVWGAGTHDDAESIPGSASRWWGASWSYSHWDQPLTGIWSVSSASIIPNTTTTTSDLVALFGTSANDVWADGQGGLLVHWDGATLQTIPSPSQAKINAIDGSAPDGVWAAGTTSSTYAWVAGENGGVARWNGVSWTVLAAPTRETLLHVTTSSTSSEVCVFGRTNTVLCRVIEP